MLARGRRPTTPPPLWHDAVRRIQCLDGASEQPETQAHHAEVEGARGEQRIGDDPGRDGRADARW